MAAVVGPVLAVTGGSSAAVVTTLAYPLLDVLLLLVVTAVLALFHWRPPAGLWFLVGRARPLFVVADLVYLFHAANGTYQPGGLNDAVWVLATLLMAFAPGLAEQAGRRRAAVLGAARHPGRRDAGRGRACSSSPTRTTLHPIADRPRRRHRRRGARPADRHLPRGRARWRTAASSP